MNLQNRSGNKDTIFEDWFKKYYLHIILGFLFIFFSFSALAPLLLKVGLNVPAKIIYWIYGFFCHQLPFRSWFFFGDQSFYPLASAGISHMISFEEYFHPATMDFGMVRSETGNLLAGYKMAICQRDFALYISLWISGLIFFMKRRNIVKIPLWVWIVFGVIPLGLDGGAQFLGNLNISFFASMAHESTPILRTITGSMFGLFTGWYIFPALEITINNK